MTLDSITQTFFYGRITQFTKYGMYFVANVYETIMQFYIAVF